MDQRASLVSLVTLGVADMPRSRAFHERLGWRAAPIGSDTKAGADVSWGGYSGYFADPDGHLWGIARNPFFPLDELGRMGLSPQEQPP